MVEEDVVVRRVLHLGDVIDDEVGDELPVHHLDADTTKEVDEKRSGNDKLKRDG